MTSERAASRVDPTSLFRRICAYIDFGPADSALLASFYPHVQPHVPAIVDDFYRRIEADPVAAAVITGGSEQTERLKKTLRDWLVRVLRGPHDAEFAALMANIGRRHVQVGLEQSYMIGGMSVFREHLERILEEVHPSGSGNGAATRRAFLKAFDVVLALMLETYREAHQRQMLAAEQNARVRRLAAIGEVAASIAHEVRNPLAGISGAIQVLRQEFGADPRRLGILNEVLAEVDRLDARIHDLLVFARPDVLRPAPSRPADLLRSTARVVADDPRFRGVRIEVEAADLPEIPLDAPQIRQVLINLLLNAVQAMGGSGSIRMDARLVEDGAVEFAVQDRGPGVREDIAEDIFRPFFTTRPDGTGLGLSISRKIIEAHGGALDVSSIPGRGARFFFVLPGRAPT